MSDGTIQQARVQKSSLVTLVLLVLPLIALGAVIALFLTTGGGLELKAPVPVEALNVERIVMQPGKILLTIRNASPQELTIAQVVINAAAWPFHADPTPTIPRLGTAVLELDYAWTYGEAYALTLFTTNAIAFNAEIPVAFETPTPDSRTFLGFTLIGLYVGVIPVYLGVLWLPALRRLGKVWMTFLLAVTAGLLIFLGIDTIIEAIEQSALVPGPFQWSGLIGIGAAGSFMLLMALSNRQNKIGRGAAEQRFSLAYMIALGIGIHNLGEGLAIGAAYNVGEIALGSFLVVGFILQNITEGLGIIAPVVRDRPGLRHLLIMGLLGGGPAILGAWIGGFSPSPILAVLFLAIGAGAIFQVVYEIVRLIQKDSSTQTLPATVYAGILTGMLLLWVTGLLIK